MRRTLSRLDVTCIGLNAIVGSGIFVLPDDLYRQLGVWSPLAFLCCLLGLLPIAWCYAQAAKLLPTTGGAHVYARQTFGSAAGFTVGWMCFANSVFSFAAVAAAAGAYVGLIWPGLAHSVWQTGVAVVVVIAFSALNYFGAKPGARAVVGFTAGKFMVLLIMVLALLTDVHLPAPNIGSSPTVENWSNATFLALFAAQGFEVVPVPAGEVQNPSRDVPFAVLSSLVGASLLYMLVQAVLVASGAPLQRATDTPLADAALAVAPVLGAVVLVGGLISTLGFVSGSALGTPRYLYALAQSKLLPAALHAVHPRFQSPHVAIIATATASLLFVVPFDYRSLVGMSNVAVAVQYFATCLAVLKLRTDTSGWRRAAPWLGAATSVWIVTEASFVELLWSVSSLAVGASVVICYRLLPYKKPPAASP